LPFGGNCLLDDLESDDENDTEETRPFGGNCLLNDDVESGNEKKTLEGSVIESVNEISNDDQENKINFVANPIVKKKITLKVPIKHKPERLDMSYIDNNHIRFSQEHGWEIRDSAGLMKYMNKYLVHWDCTSNPTIIELDYSLVDESYTMRTVDKTIKQFLPIKLAIEHWVYSTHRRSVRKVKWQSYTLIPPKIDTDTLNLFFSFKLGDSPHNPLLSV
jgi:hypothetical protein